MLVVWAALLTTLPAHANDTSVPDHRATSGLADSTYDPQANGCSSVSAPVNTPVPKALAARIWKRYGIRGNRRRRFQLDLLIPAQLGGVTDTANVWPLPRRDVPRKDAAEIAVLAQVCAGKVPLTDAQHWFADNWTTAAANADAATAAHDAVVAALEQAHLHEVVVAEWQRVADEEAAARTAAANAAAAAQASADAQLDANARAAQCQEFLRDVRRLNPSQPDPPVLPPSLACSTDPSAYLPN